MTPDESRERKKICFHQNCVISYDIEIFMEKDIEMQLCGKNAAKIHTYWKKDNEVRSI